MTWARALFSAAVALAIIGAVTSCSDETTPTATASPSAATTATTTTQATKTPEQVAGEAATTAFTELLGVTDAASQDPGSRDWEPAVRQYAADPAAYLSIQSIRDLATLGLRQEGNSRVDLEVAAVELEAPEGPTVRLSGCYDSQSTKIVNFDTGEVVPPGTPPRFVWDITVIQYVDEPGKPWLVSRLNPRTDQPC